MAEFVAVNVALDHGMSAQISSAGTGSWHIGQDADPRAHEALSRKGYSSHRHSASKFEPNKSRDLDLIVALDNENYDFLRRLSSKRSWKAELVMLRYFDPMLSGLHWEPSHEFDVPDPYLGDSSSFDESLAMIERSIISLFEKLASRLSQLIISATLLIGHYPKPESTEMDQLEPFGVTLSRFFGTDLGLTEGLWLKSGFRVPNMTYSLCD